MSRPFYVGQAGWAIAAPHKHAFPKLKSQLECFGARLSAVEINSSFYRPHQRKTYERWAASVPQSFRFAVKVPKAVTHVAKLKHCHAELERFLSEVMGLGKRLGVLLVQLPPSLAYNGSETAAFFTELRTTWSGHVACEARHATWFSEEANAGLAAYHVARVIAHPVACGEKLEPRPEHGLLYLRLHGSPKIYYSDYSAETIHNYAEVLRKAHNSAADVWCIFDNTASGCALPNALLMDSLLRDDTYQSVDSPTF